MPKVSAVIISFNEELDIVRALDSVAWCDEVLVVDSGSSDRTVEVCQARGAKVLQRAFTYYGEQKNFAVLQAANDWILAVDADEEISPELRDEIQGKLAHVNGCRGYSIPITTVLWDQVVRTGHRHTKPKLRLFDRRFGNFRKQLVHESVALDGPTERLRQPMYNYSYASISDYFDKFNRYTTLAALESSRAPRTRAGFLKAVLASPITFIQFYFLKGFIWDGLAGLAWSMFSALYPAVKQFKLMELREKFPQPQIAEDALADGLAAAQTITSRRAVPLLGPHLGWMARFMRNARRSRAARYVFAASFVAFAWFVMLLLGAHEQGADSVLLLASVAAAARVCGFRPALLATGLALLCFNYCIVPPIHLLAMPDLHSSIQLTVFASISLVISGLVHRAPRLAAQ